MKLYFEPKYDNCERCDTISHWKQVMRDEGLKKIKLHEAKIEYGTGYFFCEYFGEAGEVGHGCGKVCPQYKPRNGKNGRCRHSGHVYEMTDKTKILKS